MAFKNALKILVSKFGLCWMLLLYLLVVGLITAAIGLAFFIPMLKEIYNAEINFAISELISGVLGGDSLQLLGERVTAISQSFKTLFQTNKMFSVNTTLLIVLVFILISRFILGLYEIPMLTLIDGNMSSNAKLSFIGNYISKLGKSSRYVLVKMIYTILADVIIYLIFDAMLYLFKIPIIALFAPFLIFLVIIALLSLRYTFISMWAPSIVSGEKKIFSGFAFSVKKSSKHFLPIFSSYAVTWIIILAINVFFGIFTVGAGLIFTIPISMMFLSILNMTIYYGKNNRRYYVDVTVITPPVNEDKID